MEPSHIATKQDLLQTEARLKMFMQKWYEAITENKISNKKRYLRTKEIKNLLKVSDNKLKDMRLKGDIPYSFIGATYYYPEAEILEILERNTIKRV